MNGDENMNYLQETMAEKEFLKDTYRWFHMHPEASRHEVETHAHIREMLRAMDIRYLSPLENVTVACIGKEGGRKVGLRVDTDALQVTEQTGLEYASIYPGMMHACGHDAHIACGLCAAKLLKRHEDRLAGGVKVLFQPAEEGEMGAPTLIATHAADDIQAFFGMHVWSPGRAGELRVSPGGMTASCDMFTLRIHGRAGHGALPQECLDAVVCASAVVMNLQTIASRFISPMDPVVVTVGSLHAGTRCNVIAGEAVLEGTMRAFREDTRAALKELFERVVRETCGAYGCTVDIELRAVTGVTWNDEKLCGIARRAASEMGMETVSDEPCMMADDFADYGAIGPGCYVRVGVGNAEIGACHPHHSGLFRIDEDALPAAAAWIAGMAETYLSEK